MKLNNIRIQNYRSIEDVSIEFKNNAIFLFGKNETGKSNILKAIAQLDENLDAPEVKYNYQRDCKKPASENLEQEPTSINYSFLTQLKVY